MVRDCSAHFHVDGQAVEPRASSLQPRPKAKGKGRGHEEKGSEGEGLGLKRATPARPPSQPGRRKGQPSEQPTRTREAEWTVSALAAGAAPSQSGPPSVLVVVVLPGYRQEHLEVVPECCATGHRQVDLLTGFILTIECEVPSRTIEPCCLMTLALTHFPDYSLLAS
jgi:hypothetical protein